MFLIRVLYKPFAIIGAIISARIGRQVFNSIWSAVDDKPPALPGSGQSSAVKTVAGTALQAGVLAGSAAAVDRVFASAFHHVIGAWPRKPAGPRTAEQAEAQPAARADA